MAVKAEAAGTGKFKGDLIRRLKDPDVPGGKDTRPGSVREKRPDEKRPDEKRLDPIEIPSEIPHVADDPKSEVFLSFDAYDDSYWICPECETHNGLDQDRCSACGYLR